VTDTRAPRLRVAVLASGRGSNFTALAEASTSGRLPIELVGVFSDRTRAPVLARASALGVPALALAPKQFPGLAEFEAALFAAIDAVQPDLIVCAGYMRVLGAATVQQRHGRMINIHPSLLPLHRGLHTHQRALEAGDAEHGASVHFVTPELDGGPVISQARVPVLPQDSAETLAERVLGGGGVDARPPAAAGERGPAGRGSTRPAGRAGAVRRHAVARTAATQPI
jgi:phosphoribosylglycinamide formyltransferase 1